MLKLYAMMAGVAVSAAIAGTFIYSQLAGTQDRFAQCRGSAVAGGAEIGGPFTLVGSGGQLVTDTDVITGPTLIYFGYTFCPDVCPFDVARNAIAIDILAERGVNVTPVFISVDPERDTPDVVGDFAYNMHPEMIGLTGSPEQVDVASKAYKTYYRRQDGSDDYYLVDHSTFSYLVDPTHGFLEFYRRDTSPEEMANSIACFVDAV